MFMNSLTLVDAQLVAVMLGGVIGGLIGCAITLAVFCFWKR